MRTKPFTWTVQFTVDPTWVEDGFDLTEERAHDMISSALPSAFNYEFSSKVLKAPSKATILKEQGYSPAQISKQLKKLAADRAKQLGAVK
jgi:hypothetical protein